LDEKISENSTKFPFLLFTSISLSPITRHNVASLKFQPENISQTLTQKSEYKRQQLGNCFSAHFSSFSHAGTLIMLSKPSLNSLLSHTKHGTYSSLFNYLHRNLHYTVRWQRYLNFSVKMCMCALNVHMVQMCTPYICAFIAFCGLMVAERVRNET
jgi:hypothetical protein